MADVFISYHEKSAGELAAQIAAALESAGISCWYAKRDIPPGGDFARYIPPQIDACKVFLLILTENVYQSNHIENEVGLAFSRLNKGENITIIPLEIGDFERKSWVAYYLIHTQSVKIPCLDEAYIHEVTQKISNILDKEQPSNENSSSKTVQVIHTLDTERIKAEQATIKAVIAEINAETERNKLKALRLLSLITWFILLFLMALVALLYPIKLPPAKAGGVDRRLKVAFRLKPVHI